MLEKITTIVQLYERIPDKERFIVDILRQIVQNNLPSTCKEKISFSVPYFYGNKGICIIWPSAIPRGGINKGVLFGFWYGNKLNDTENYLTHGTNKQIFYKVFHSIEEIDVISLEKLMKEAVLVDKLHSKQKK